MNLVSHSYVMRMAPWAIPVLTLGIFLFDVLTPVGVAVSVLYLLPLLLTFFSPRKRDPLYFSIISTGLIWLDLLLKPPGIPMSYGAFNRALGTFVLWGVTLGLIRYRQMHEGLRTAEAERAEAIVGREAAVEARALSDAAAAGALATSHVAEQQLLISQLRLESIIDSAMDAIITIDGHQKIVLFNAAAEKMFYCAADQARGRSIDQFIPARFRQAHQGHVESFGVSGATSRRMGALGRVSGLRADGTEFPIESAISQVGVEGKQYFTVILRDVSERERMNEQLRKAERLAELGTLASGMAHEIGTPMNVILGRAEYLMDRVQDEPIRKGLQTIVAQVERITKVMNQLLSFARRKTPERAPVALQEVIDNSLEMFQERLARSRIRVDLATDDACRKVQADADQMNQVVINLVMNAIQAMPDGGTLRIGLSPEKDMIKITVADTGHGIPRDTVGRIFEPFFTTKEFGKGTGLGLTVVKGIVEEHQGTIAVESEEGKGTTFTILLPKSD